MRRTQWLEAAVQDARFGIRTFRKKPGFTLSVLAVLAFGVGSATAIFSIVNDVLLTALPYRAPGNLVRIFGAWQHGSREGISPPDFADYRQRNSSFESMAAAGISTPLLNLTASAIPSRCAAETSPRDSSPCSASGRCMQSFAGMTRFGKRLRWRS